MAAELPRPGVEIIQVFRSVSPTVITPTLVPCVVGVCKQIVDVLTTTSSGGSVLNGDALVPLQAGFVAKAGTGSPATYSGLDGLDLVFSVNHAPDVTVTFVGSILSPGNVVAQVRKALGDAGVTTATAETVGDSQWRLRTYAANEFQTIEIKGTSDSAVLAAFGIGAQRIYAGSSYYSQDAITIAPPAFPDPRKNLSQLSVENDSLRAFLYMGGTSGALKEVLRTESFLTSGAATPAVFAGTVDMSTLTYPTDLNGLTLVVSINGGADLTVTFSSPANAAAALSQINAVINAVATATEGTSNHLKVTTSKIGTAASIQFKTGTANTALGITPGTVTGATAVASIDDGNGDAVTPFVQLVGYDFTASPTTADYFSGAFSTTASGDTLTLDDGTGPQTITFGVLASTAAIATAIQDVMGTAAGGKLTAVAASGAIHLTNYDKGKESVIRILGQTGTIVGFGVGDVVHGTAFKPLPGDELWVNGALYGVITQVAPGGHVDRLKLDRQVPISADIGNYWHIVAKGLDASASSNGDTRPTPDLVITADGSVHVKQEIIRDTVGNVSYNSKAQLYLAYHAVREDVTSMATNPALLRFSDTATLTSRLAPVNGNNPLALGLYFALLNAPGVQVTGLGVDAISAAAPYGTVEAFARAATFLEAYEVYAVAPLTHDQTVGQVFDTHATVMSDPANKGERIALFNPAQPTSKLDTLVASGLTGNSLSTSNTFDTGVANLGALLLGQGLDPTGAFQVSDGLYLDVGDGKKYSIYSVSGPVVTVKVTGFLPGDNDDGYYATSGYSTPIINGAFAVRVRGAALVLTDGSPDKDSIALTYQGMAAGHANRRFWQVIPGLCAATLGGLEQVLEGFYMLAAIAGMIGKNPPQQSFTNFPMTGFTRVIGSNGFLTEKQLNIAAAGGNYIIVQDDEGAPLISRMALTSDVTSIETRTDSITKVVDFTAKFLRRGLKNFIGRFNITQGFLDSLSHVIQGLLSFLSDSGVLIGSHLNNIMQDEDAPDTVLIDITLDVPFPCNYIRLTLVI